MLSKILLKITGYNLSWRCGACFEVIQHSSAHNCRLFALVTLRYWSWMNCLIGVMGIEKQTFKTYFFRGL